MNKYDEENLIDYADMRIKAINNYIDFNERKGEKDFFANKELELFKIAKESLEKKATLKSEAFDVIKQKRVNVGKFYLFINLGRGYDDYLLNNNIYWNISDSQSKPLTKEEYNLLKQALEVDNE